MFNVATNGKMFFPLVDQLTAAEMKKFKITAGKYYKDIKGVRTGEFRAPQAGEWYLSGAVPEVYRAKANMLSPFNICKLVRVRREEIFTMEE